MIKVKDGYAKLIGTTASGSASRVLLSNGGDHVLGNASGNIPLNNGTVSTNLNADMLDGLHIHTGRNNEANKVVRTDASGYILAGWINTTSGDMGTTAATRIYCSNDGYIRYKTPANFFSALTNSSNLLSITVGDQNRKVTVAYATNAGSAANSDTVDYYHMGSWGHYKYSKTVSDATNAVWYIKVVFNTNWNSDKHYIHFNPAYNNISGRLFFSLSSYDTSGYIALVSTYNGCNIKGFYIYRDSSASKLTMYLKLAAYTSATCTMYSTLEISSATVVSAPSVTFKDVSTANRIYTDMYIAGGGFIKNGSSDDCVLLGGGGHKTIASFQTTYDNRYVKKAGDTMTGTLAMSTGAAIHLWDDSATASHRLTLRCASDIGRIYNYTGSAYGAMYIGHDGTNAIVITSGLNVGIGVSPTLKLHVNGNAIATNLGVNSTAGSGQGISLYGGSGYVSTYGIAFVTTGNWGTHGYVTGDWATYFTMSNTENRGWVFRRSGSGNVFSIDCDGHAYANGLVNASRFHSRVATGTLPYACTSTTLNTNLNADLLDGIHASGLLTAFSYTDMTTAGAAPYYSITVGGTTKTASISRNVLVRKSYIYSATADLASYWCKVADITLSYSCVDYTATIIATRPYGSTNFVVLKWNCRTNCSTTSAPSHDLYYIGTPGIGGSFRSYHSGAGNTTKFELWANGGGRWCGWTFTVVNESGRGGADATGATYYRTSFSSVQTPSLSTYISATWIAPNTLTFAAGAFSAKTYNGSSAVTVNVPTHTSHLTNDSGFWTGTRYWANVAVSTSSSTSTSPTFATSYATTHLSSSLIYLKTGDATMKIYANVSNSSSYGSEGVTIQTAFDGLDPASSSYPSSYPTRAVLQLLPRGGNVAIGQTTANSYKVHISGSLYASSWLRTGGSTGWYNESYAGGWYMTDSTWIRSFNNKPVRISVSTYPSIECNADSGSESNLRFAIAGTIKGYVGFHNSYGTFLYNSAAAKYVYINNSGYFYTLSYINVGAGNEKNASNPPYVWGVNGSDNFMRTYATSSLSVNYASSAGSASSSGYIWANSISNLNSPTTWSSDGSRLVYDIYSGSASNKPVSVDNANGLITLFKSKHGTSGQYVTQIAAPDNGRLYTRYSLGGGWQAWRTLAWTSDIPSVGNGTVTIKQAGATKGSFTMNQSGNTTIELTDNNTNTWRPIYWAVYLIFHGTASNVSFTKKAGNHNFFTSGSTTFYRDAQQTILAVISYPSGWNEDTTMIFGNGSVSNKSDYLKPCILTVQKEVGDGSKVRFIMSDDASVENRACYAWVYFLCIG